MTRDDISFSRAFALLAALAFAGCGNTAQQATVEKTSSAKHAHADVGPHRGHLIELGDERYHAELTHDDATKTVTIYLLDSEAKNPVAIPAAEIVLNLVIAGQPLQAKLAAAPQQGDPAGQASRFSITDEKVLEAHDAPQTRGRLNVTIDGKTYSGVVENHEHVANKH